MAAAGAAGRSCAAVRTDCEGIQRSRSAGGRGRSWTAPTRTRRNSRLAGQPWTDAPSADAIKKKHEKEFREYKKLKTSGETPIWESLRTIKMFSNVNFYQSREKNTGTVDASLAAQFLLVVPCFGILSLSCGRNCYRTKTEPPSAPPPPQRF